MQARISQLNVLMVSPFPTHTLVYLFFFKDRGALIKENRFIKRYYCLRIEKLP